MARNMSSRSNSITTVTKTMHANYYHSKHGKYDGLKQSDKSNKGYHNNVFILSVSSLCIASL